jgi:hypothetical protein
VPDLAEHEVDQAHEGVLRGPSAPRALVVAGTLAGVSAGQEAAAGTSTYYVKMRPSPEATRARLESIHKKYVECRAAGASCPYCGGHAACGFSAEELGLAPEAAPVTAPRTRASSAAPSILQYGNLVRAFLEHGGASALAGRDRHEVLAVAVHESRHAVAACRWTGGLTTVSALASHGSEGRTSSYCGGDLRAALRVLVAPEPGPGSGHDERLAAEVAARLCPGDEEGARRELLEARRDVAALFNTFEGREAVRALTVALLHAGEIAGDRAERLVDACGVGIGRPSLT